MPFVGILAMIWTLAALISAIFPGNRLRRIKIAGTAFVIFVVTIVASPRVESAAENQDMVDAGVYSREELAAVWAQQVADDAAIAVNSYVELVESQIAIVRELSEQDFQRALKK